MALLSNHCEQFSLLLAQTLTTPSQLVTVEFQFTGTQQDTKDVHARLQITHRQRQPQANQIGSGRLGFQLPGKDSLQEIDRQECLRQSDSQHLHVHRMGKIAETTRQCPFHALHPGKESIRHGRQEMGAAAQGVPYRQGGRKRSLRWLVLKSISGQFEQ